MESLEKDHSYSELPQHSETTTEEYEVPDAVVVTRRLRDRELLRKRRAEAEEKDTHQWALGDQSKSKRARKGRRTGRGRGRRQAHEPQAEPQTGGVEEKHELKATLLEEKAETSLDPQMESSLAPQAEFCLDPQVESCAPLIDTEDLYTPKEVTEATLTGPTICPVAGLEQTPRSEEPEMLASVGNDHLEQEFYASL